MDYRHRPIFRPLTGIRPTGDPSIRVVSFVLWLHTALWRMLVIDGMNYSHRPRLSIRLLGHHLVFRRYLVRRYSVTHVLLDCSLPATFRRNRLGRLLGWRHAFVFVDASESRVLGFRNVVLVKFQVPVSFRRGWSRRSTMPTTVLQAVGRTSLVILFAIPAGVSRFLLWRFKRHLVEGHGRFTKGARFAAFHHRGRKSVSRVFGELFQRVTGHSQRRRYAGIRRPVRDSGRRAGARVRREGLERADIYQPLGGSGI